MRVIAGSLPFLLLLCQGCTRKLPGPAECRAFALASVGVGSKAGAALLAWHPELAERADEVTRKCLTTPWDYQLLNCLQDGGSARVCSSRFEARRRARQLR